MGIEDWDGTADWSIKQFHDKLWDNGFSEEFIAECNKRKKRKEKKRYKKKSKES